jgi:hypothetical protein
MPNTIVKQCEHCGTEYTAVRSTAKYCSDSCKTIACRDRKEEERKEKLLEDERKRIEQERLEKELKEKKEQEDALNREKARKDYESNKRIQEANSDVQLYILLGLGVLGVINLAVNKYFGNSKKTSQKPDNQPPIWNKF